MKVVYSAECSVGRMERMKAEYWADNLVDCLDIEMAGTMVSNLVVL